MDDRERREKAREADETLPAVLRDKLEANRPRFVLTDTGRLERTTEEPEAKPGEQS